MRSFATTFRFNVANGGRRHAVRLGVAVLLVPIIGIASQFAVGAASVSVGCSDPTPYKWLPAGAVTANPIDAAGLAALAQQKKAVDAQNPGLQAELATARAVSVNPREKAARLKALEKSGLEPSTVTMDAACSSVGARRGSLWQRFNTAAAIGTTALASDTASYGSGYAWLNNFNQQGQANSYYCGPATVAESSTTEAVGVSQSTAASYMGTNSNGTDTGSMTSGMVHYIGQPVFGYTFYGWVSVPYSPTQTDKNTFMSNLSGDIQKYLAAPVAGDAWEAAGGPHLNGHPANQTIFHYFEIGGWNTNNSTTYYADSATSIWSTVPAYSWFDAWTMVVILGGRGYIW